jgi:uncharacterized protein YggE
MKHALAALAFACAAPLAHAQIINPKPYDPATVEVAGRAELYLPPDQARVSVGFYSPGRTAPEATEAVNSRARAFEAAIRAIDPKTVRLERSDSTVTPVMKGGGDRRPDRIQGYEARANLTVLVSDLALLSRAVETAVNANPDTFGDVDFSVKDTVAARRKAREAAVTDAVEKAKIYTEGAGHRLGRLLKVEEGGSNMIAQSGNRAVMRARAVSAEMDAVTAPPVAFEPQLYTAEVTLVYEVGPAIAPR